MAVAMGIVREALHRYSGETNVWRWIGMPFLSQRFEGFGSRTFKSGEVEV